MPSRWAAWLAAIRIPEADRKPAITGWLRKLVKNPRRSRPMATSISPESNDSTRAACRYSGVPGVATPERAAPVISAMMATGPTARVRLVPSRA
jgi:hypothetical protein